MSNSFRCCMCGDAAVTAHVYEDGSERLYCAQHIFGPDPSLEETYFGHAPETKAAEPVFAARNM